MPWNILTLSWNYPDIGLVTPAGMLQQLSLSLWHLCPDIFTSSNPLLSPVGFPPRQTILFLHHPSGFLHIFFNLKQLYRLHISRATYLAEEASPKTCPTALILPCLFLKYLPCHTLSLLAWSPVTARKLRSTGFKGLVPNYLPTPPDPWQNPTFTSDQAPSAQMTFGHYFSCFLTQHHHFHISTRRIYNKLCETHRTSVPVNLDYTHTQK